MAELREVGRELSGKDSKLSRLAFALSLLFLAFGLLAPAGASAAPGDFASAGDFPVSSAFDLVTGDFNDDGTVDAATVDANADIVSVLLGDGDGTFTAASGSPLDTSDSPRGLAAGDLDGDSDDDLVVTESGTDTLRTFLSDGDGTFTDEGTTATGADPFKVTLGLFDGDTVLDAAVANAASEAPNGNLSVLLGNGSGDFASAPSSPYAIGGGPSRVIAAQLSSDAHLDLAVANSLTDNVTVLLGNSTGVFAPAASSPEPVGDGPSGLVAAALNADAPLDLATANNFGENVSILLGSATADFTAAPSSPESQGDSDLTAADLDGDGDRDIATFEGLSSVQLLLGNGTGDFTASGSAPVLGLTSQIEHADTDSDGDIDLLSAGGNGGDFAVTSLLNNEQDSDSDGYLDVADECVNLGGATRGCPFFSRTATLKYKKRAQAFKGEVVSIEPSCAGPGVELQIRKSLSAGGHDVIGTAETNAAGKYRLDEKVKRGRFTAVMEETVDPDEGICATSFSPTIQVRP